MAGFTQDESNLRIRSGTPSVGKFVGAEAGPVLPCDVCALFPPAGQRFCYKSGFSKHSELVLIQVLFLWWERSCAGRTGLLKLSVPGQQVPSWESWCAEEISPGLRPCWVSRLGRVRSNSVPLPKIAATLCNPLASWPSGKASLSRAQCLGKKEEEGMCWAGSVSSPLSPPKCLSAAGKSPVLQGGSPGCPSLADWKGAQGSEGRGFLKWNDTRGLPRRS